MVYDIIYVKSLQGFHPRCSLTTAAVKDNKQQLFETDQLPKKPMAMLGPHVLTSQRFLRWCLQGLSRITNLPPAFGKGGTLVRSQAEVPGTATTATTQFGGGVTGSHRSAAVGVIYGRTNISGPWGPRILWASSGGTSKNDKSPMVTGRWGGHQVWRSSCNKGIFTNSWLLGPTGSETTRSLGGTDW